MGPLQFLIDMLTEPSDKQVEFGIGGLCNVALGKSDCILTPGLIHSNETRP